MLTILNRWVRRRGLAPKIVCRAVIRDRCEGAAIARVMSPVFTIFILVPMIAPMIGQGLLLVAGWRWIFCLYLFWAGTARLWFMIRQPETLAREQCVPLSLKRLCLNSGRILKAVKSWPTPVHRGWCLGHNCCFWVLRRQYFRKFTMWVQCLRCILRFWRQVLAWPG